MALAADVYHDNNGQGDFHAGGFRLAAIGSRMTFRARIAAAFVLFAAVAQAVEPARSAAPQPVKPAPPAARLPAERMARAIKIDSLTIPTPGELFAALEKPGKPNWPTHYRAPIPMTYRNRGQIALNLGGLIADGFIAVEAQDSQQVKNIGTDIIKLAKALGVSENVLSRGNSINEFAENDEWDALQEELEATQNEVKSSMQTHRDQDLVILVSVGGWIRGTQVVSGCLKENFDERAARVLRQPAVVNFIHAKINDVSEDLRNEPLVKDVNAQLPRLEQLVSFPAGKAPTIEDVRKINETVSQLIEEIQNKPEAK